MTEHLTVGQIIPPVLIVVHWFMNRSSYSNNKKVLTVCYWNGFHPVHSKSKDGQYWILLNNVKGKDLENISIRIQTYDIQGK